MMSSNIAAVAFDMDGLMYDTEDVYWKAADELLRIRGHEYTVELAEDVMGRQPRYCFERMIEYYDLSGTSWEELFEESQEIFMKKLDEGFSEMPGLSELLGVLEEQGIPKAVCTSSSRRVAREVLGRTGVLSGFSFVLAFEDVLQGKPDPEIYLKAAERFGISPGEMLVLEDSISGCTAAKQAGAFTVAVLAEHNRTLDFSHADLVLERLDDPGVLERF